MKNIRKFNEKGIERLKQTLIACKSKSNKISKVEINKIKELLFDTKLSVEIKADINYEPDLIFDSAMKVGKYYFEHLSDIDNKLRNDNGLWTWLCISSFENYLKPVANELFVLGAVDKYIFNINDYQRYYRHPVYMPYQIYSRFQESLASEMFLEKPPYVSGEFLEGFASRQNLFSNDSLIRMLSEKVYNPKKGKFPNKFLGKDRKHPSSVAYMTIWEKQVSMNFDLFECDPDLILSLIHI